MTPSFTPLPWDSEFFGFPIAKVELTDRSPDEITAIEDAARADGIVCLYGSLDPADATSSLAAQTLGWRLVEAAVMYSLHPREIQMPHPPGISVRLGTADDLPELEPLIALLAPWSRFSADPRFGEDAALRMQTAWIERAAKCTTGEFELVVAVNDDDHSIVAFVSRAREPKPIVDTIGTLAVGAGAARMLIQVSRDWVGEGSLLGGPIAARNTTASRFVQTVGYRATWTRYLFHRWLDEPQGRADPATPTSARSTTTGQGA